MYYRFDTVNMIIVIGYAKYYQISITMFSANISMAH